MIYGVAQAQWYVKNQALHGQKRNFDNIEYKDQSRKVVSHDEAEVDEFIPWTTFKREGIAEGRSVPELENDWKELTEGPATEAIWRRNQWLVPRFAGVRRAKVRKTEQVSEMARCANVESSEELAQLQRGAESLLEQFDQSVQPARSVLPADMPVTNASIADQPVTSAPSDVISQQIHREASWEACTHAQQCNTHHRCMG